MLHADFAESAHLFIGSTHIAAENAENSEFAREWMRRQASEAAARRSIEPRQIVDLPTTLGQIAPALPFNA